MEATAQFLHHPFHPMLVNGPIAFVAAVLLFDLLYYWRDRDPFWSKSANVLSLLAVLSTAAAAIPGLIDYYTVAMPPIAGTHMKLGIALFVLLLIQVLVRRARPGEATPRVALPLSILAMAMVAYQGWLGGELVFHYRVAVMPAAAAGAGTSSNGNEGGSGVASTGGRGSTGAGGSGTGGAVTSLPPAEVTAAKTLFTQKCAGCHRIGGTGGQIGPDLSREGQSHDAAWIAVQITAPQKHNPSTGMPAFPDLAPDQLKSLSGYLAALK